MQIILLEPTRLGQVGDVVEVKGGYARNFLIPQGMALAATRGNLKSLEARIKSRQKELAQEKKTAEAMAERMKDLTVELSVRAGEGKIYGAVTHADVAAALAEKGFEVDRRKLEMPKTLKDIGEYEISYRAHPEVSVPLKLVVHAQK
ncbi:50S ribosomal protein L9 [Deinococcus sp.]|uniref:50S ribosomal protein L9 n=1 Tax=Deinococcus sp. TaxID=47478 RepID=UPI003B5A829F